MQGFRSVCVMLVVTGLGSLVAPGRTEAGLLRLNMSGETFPGSEIAGSPFASGTPWSLAAEFDTASLTEGSQGLYSAPANSLTVVIGATTYTATAPGSMNVLLGSAGNIYVPGVEDSSSNGILPLYSTSSDVNWNAAAPTPTVFGGFFNISSLYFIMATDQGSLILAATPSLTLQASITAVPEPSLVSLAIGGAAFGLVALRRRARRG